MKKSPPFGKIILIGLSMAALAFFSCLGALSGKDTALAVGGTGFAIGLIGFLLCTLWLFYYLLVWFVDHVAPPRAPGPPPIPQAPPDAGGPDVPPQDPLG